MNFKKARKCLARARETAILNLPKRGGLELNTNEAKGGHHWLGGYIPRNFASIKSIVGEGIPIRIGIG